MRQNVLGSVLLAVAAVALPAVAAAQADSRPGVAVLPFAHGGSFGQGREDITALEVGLQQLFIEELALNTNMRLVERTRLRELLAEQDLAAQGRVDAGTAARLGQLVGARYVVTGSYLETDGRFYLGARIVDGETGELLKAERLEGRRTDMYRMTLDLATRLVQGVDLPPLSAELRDARSERSRGSRIPEQAIDLLGRAQLAMDAGESELAIELYEEIADRFPTLTDASAALRQLRGG
jgi:TolB-like protein